MTDELVYSNGINGLTGEYLKPPIPISELAESAVERRKEPDDRGWLERVVDVAGQDLTYGMGFQYDETDTASVGWAVVFNDQEEQAVRDALAPLIEHRRATAGDVTRELDYHEGESWRDWLARYRTGPGNPDPNKVPYYVLLVGGPDRIPFSFQYLLDVEWAVGRLDLPDAESYSRYAQTVIASETGNAKPRDETVAFFGTRHAGDGATELSARSLVTPLADGFSQGGHLHDHVPPVKVERMLGDPAKKVALGDLFSGKGELGRPKLLFSATHGMGGWPAGHPDQEANHGALLCQDWPGPGRGQIGAQQYFAAADLAADADVAGLVAIFFACYGAGTPQVDAFDRVPSQAPPVIADRPFVARLPKALLGAGALAAVGHVERAWGYSFVSARGDEQLTPFEDALGRILCGEPVGHAMTMFNSRYSSLSAGLLTTLDDAGAGKVVSDAEIVRDWTERNDAQNYVVLGDPAVRLPMAA